MINKAILMGRVGKDPDVRSTNNGKVATFSLATSESWKDRDGEWQERTQWHNVVVWAEGAVKYTDNNVRKGDMIFLEGQVETRKYEKDGRDVYVTEIVLRPFSSSIRKVPTGEKRGDGGGRSDRRDDRDRDRDRGRDRDDRRDDKRGRGDDRGRGRYDDSEEIPF